MKYLGELAFPSVSPHLSVSFCLSVFVSVSQFLCLSVCLYLCLCFSLFISLFVSVSLSPSLSLSRVKTHREGGCLQARQQVCSPLLLDFPTSGTVRNKCLFKLSSLWHVVMPAWAWAVILPVFPFENLLASIPTQWTSTVDSSLVDLQCLPFPTFLVLSLN